MTMNLVERVARALAMGDYDAAHKDKADWRRTRGYNGDTYRGINDPRQDEYREAARAAIAEVLDAMGQPSEGMREAIWSQVSCIHPEQSDLEKGFEDDILQAMLAQFKVENIGE